ncbi:hypothetical protein BKK81_33460 (plasmid) [Cupriavidus sp. USMAHM13]|uniref:DUF883 family protein n=1 Tax=Cupriavidus sp. USMAHM13 TaxID=1389192 RepID=UPI0008A6DBD7|nr:DUF883 family protein [Cupriavidus sp. USMAHM13]AOZ04294.1 hypothetical protein BKK81_33460 [Cupriavidus sp. USMAHM13]
MDDKQSDRRAQRDALIRDTSVLLADVQALLIRIAEQAGAEGDDARAELVARARALQMRLESLRGEARHRISHWAEETKHYVQRHPWHCLGTVAAIAAAAGAIMGWSAKRR